MAWRLVVVVKVRPLAVPRLAGWMPTYVGYLSAILQLRL